MSVIMDDKDKQELVNMIELPDYVRGEAERVTKNVQSIRTGKSLTMIHLSDVHASATDVNTDSSLEMAGKGIVSLRKLMAVDGAVVHGDLSACDGEYTVLQCKEDFTKVKTALADAFNGIPTAYLPGNHEINYGIGRDRTTTENEIFAYLGANDVGVTKDVNYPEKNYGYIDYPNQRIRVICLNTADTLTEFTADLTEKAESEHIGAEQLDWLANTALDFSDKTDVSKWGIVICSHHPLNYKASIIRALQIIEAYKDGTSGTITYTSDKEYTVSYDFTNGDKAEIICNIHGHSHNFGYKQISSSSNVDAWLWRVCVPCVNVGRENEHATNEDLKDAFGEFDAEGNPVYFRKTLETANGTSFNIITIDRENGIIYAHCYGTGYDRKISYKQTDSGNDPEETTYTNLVATSECTDSTDVYNDGLGYKDGYYLSSSSGNESTKSGHVVTGMIPYIVNSGTSGVPGAIYVKGATVDRIGLYLEDKSFKSIMYSGLETTELDTNYIKLTPTTNDSGNAVLYETYGNIRYLRFDCVGTGADLIITVDEEIV